MHNSQKLSRVCLVAMQVEFFPKHSLIQKIEEVRIKLMKFVC
jgi:hypothetical protein